MNRVIAAVTTVAAAATIAMAAGTMPALAAPRPAPARPAAVHARAVLPRTLRHVIVRAFGHSTDLTIGRCTRAIGTPPPLRLEPAAAREAARTGRGPVTAIARLLGPPDAIKMVYTCTIIVEVKAAAGKQKARAVDRGRKDCGFGTASTSGPASTSGTAGGSGTEIGCSRVVILGTGFGGAAARAAVGRAIG